MGDVTRSLAKPSVMVYIYGAMMSSIRRKMTESIVVPKIYKLLNSKEYANMTFADLNKKLLGGSDSYFIALLNSDMSDKDPKALEAEYELNVLRAMFNDGSTKLEFKVYDNGVIRNANNDEKVMKNLLISTKMMNNLNDSVSNTLGDAFADGFKVFKPIDDFRLSVKTLEVLRFSTFKFQYTKKLKRLAKNLGNGSYEISTNDMAKVLAELEIEGYGHSVEDINGGHQPLYSKQQQVVNTIQTALHLGKNQYKSGLVNTKDFKINSGAAGVIIIHSLDGYVDSTSASLFKLIRIYDGSVSGINTLIDQSVAFNETTSVATEFSTYNTQLNHIAKNISEMIKYNEFDEMLKTMAPQDIDDLTTTLEKLMGYIDVEYITDAVIQSLADGVRDRIQENEAFRTTDGESREIGINNQYLTDAADAFAYKLKPTADKNIAKLEGIQVVYDAFKDVIHMLQAKRREARYGDDEHNYDSLSRSVNDAIITDDTLKDYKDTGTKQTVYMYPTSLEYKSDISGMSKLNATYQKDVPIIAIPIRSKANSSLVAYEDIKAIKDGIDTAFSLIPKGYDVKIQSGITDLINDANILDHFNKALDKLQDTSSVKTEYKAPANDDTNNSNEQKNANGGSKGKIELKWLNDNTNVITDQNENSSIKINNIDDLISVSDQYHELITNRGVLYNHYIDYAKYKQIYIDLIKQINDAGLKAKPFVINFQPEIDLDNIGVFDSTTNQMFLPTDMSMNAYPLKIVAHAYAKSVTSSLLDRNIQVYNRITAIREAAEEGGANRYKNNSYALTSNAVFVAEVLVNPGLQKSLSKIPSIGSKGLEIIKKVFAYLLGNVSKLSKDEREKMDSLLHDALSAIYKLHNPDFDNENNVENESNNKGHAYADHSVEDGAVSYAIAKYGSLSQEFSDNMNDIMSGKESDKIFNEVRADC
jgi:hypothetical protein